MCYTVSMPVHTCTCTTPVVGVCATTAVLEELVCHLCGGVRYSRNNVAEQADVRPVGLHHTEVRYRPTADYGMRPLPTYSTEYGMVRQNRPTSRNDAPRTDQPVGTDQPVCPDAMRHTDRSQFRPTGQNDTPRPNQPVGDGATRLTQDAILAGQVVPIGRPAASQHTNHTEWWVPLDALRPVRSVQGDALRSTQLDDGSEDPTVEEATPIDWVQAATAALQDLEGA